MRQYQVELVLLIQTNIRNPNLKSRSNPDFNSPPTYLSIIFLSPYLPIIDVSIFYYSSIYTYLSIANLTKLSFLPHFYFYAPLCVLPGVEWSRSWRLWLQFYRMIREQEFRFMTTWDNFHCFALYRKICLGQYVNEVWKITQNRCTTAWNFISIFIGHIY